MARKDENLSPEEEQLKQLKEDQKAFKREQKNQKKEAKKRAKELENQQRELDEQIDGTNASVVVVTLFIIAIWLGILCLLVKMDVGGFGSNVLTPILKDVPVINKILPSESGTETTKDKAYGGYNSIKDAVEEINSLQKQMETLQNNNTSYSEQIEALKAEVQRLQTFGIIRLISSVSKSSFMKRLCMRRTVRERKLTVHIMKRWTRQPRRHYISR